MAEQLHHNGHNVRVSLGFLEAIKVRFYTKDELIEAIREVSARGWHSSLKNYHRHP